MPILIKLTGISLGQHGILMSSAPVKHLGPYANIGAAEDALRSHGWQQLKKSRKWDAPLRSTPYIEAEIIETPDEICDPGELPEV